MANSTSVFKGGGWVSPEIVAKPSLGFDVLNSPDPNSTSPVVSHAARTMGLQDAVQENANTYDTSNFWQNLTQAATGTFGAITKPIGTALEWLNKPLQEISKDYKFLHAVYTDHGPLAGVLATLGVAAGGAVGAFAGPAGIAAGADLAAEGIRQTMGRALWQDSYAKSEDDNYKISFGRDFSNALGTASSMLGQQNWAKSLRDTNNGIGKFVSGATDAAFDVSADPINVIGKAAWMMKSGKLLKATDGELNLAVNVPFQDSVEPIKNFLAARSQKFYTPEQMDAMRASDSVVFNGVARGYNRFLDRVGQTVTDLSVKDAQVQNEFYQANKVYAIDPETSLPLNPPQILRTTPHSMAVGRIIQEFPELGNPGAEAIVSAAEAARAKTPEAVADVAHDVLKTRLLEGDLMDTFMNGSMVPVRSVIKTGLKPVLDAAANLNNPVGKTYRTFTGYMPRDVNPDLMEQSLGTVQVNSPSAASTLGAFMNFSQNRRFAMDMMGQYSAAVASGNIGLAKAIYKQGIFETFKGMGISETLAPAAWQKLTDAPFSSADDALYGVAANEKGALGSYINKAGVAKSAALFTHQMTDEMPIPNFFEVRKLMRDEGNLSNSLLNNPVRSGVGNIGDFIARHYTNAIFKPMALMTMGFGFRVAAAELIPQVARNGVLPIVKAGIAWSGARSQWKIDQRGIDASLTAHEAELAAKREAVRALGKDATDAMDSASLIDAGMELLSNGRAIDAATPTRGFNLFRDNVDRLNLKFAQKMTSAEQVGFVFDMMKRYDGHVPSMVAAGHSASSAGTSYGDGMLVHAVAVDKHMAAHAGDLNKFRLFATSDPNFNNVWLLNAQKASRNTAQKLIMRDANNVLHDYATIPLDSQDAAFAPLRARIVEKEYNRLLEAKNGTGPYYGPKSESHMGVRFADGDLHQYAQDRVDATLGLVTGQDGTYHHGLAKMIADGHKPNISHIDRIDQMSAPKAMPGKTKYLYVPGGNLMEKIINTGFAKVMDPIVNHLAREPIFVLHAADEYKSLEHALSTGMIDHDAAMKIASSRAGVSMLPEIHNVMLRSQFAQLARNYMPFYFAQEQAVRRTVRAMKDTSFAGPLASTTFRYFQMLEHTLSDPSIVTDDGSGNKYVNIPGGGPLGEWIQAGLAHLGMPMVANLPMSVSGNLASLNSVLPEANLPGVSPFVSYSIDLVNRIMPEFGPAPVQAAEQVIKGAGAAVAGRSANRGFWDTVVPNAPFKNMFLALSFDEQQSAVANAIIGAIASAGYHGQIPDANAPDSVKQAFIDRVKNNARSLLVVKAMFGMVSPLAPKVEQVDPGLREEFMKMVRDKGDYQKAMVAFLGEHGNRAVSYTVSKTSAEVPGANVQYTQQVSDWIKKNNSLVQGPNGMGALYLLPQAQATNVDWTVYNELLRQHLRTQRTPEQFLQQFYIASGDQAVSAAMAAHDQAKVAYKNVPYLMQQADQEWSQVVAQMQHLYPDWSTAYSSGQGKTNAQRVVSQLSSIFSSPDAPQDSQAVAVRGLLGEYMQHEQTLAMWRGLNNTSMVNSEKTQWAARLQQIQDSDPMLMTVAKSVFGKLD